MTVVLDTCALLWVTLDPDMLSPKAQKTIANAEALLVSSISIWEVGVKWRANKLELGASFEEYAVRVCSCRDFQVVPVDARLWANSVMLEWEHRDPVDRLIVSLAQQYDCALISSDKQLAQFYRRCIE
ncbi:MAG: type II toxin-antitoxin system VapC family toxin [Pseudomonadota bacterium]